MSIAPADLVGGPLARPPVQRLAGRDDVAHRPHRLLERRVRVGPVAVEDVDEVLLQPLERAVDGLHQVLAVERVAHVRRLWRPQNTFVVRTYDQRGQPSSPKDATHDRLALPAGVGLGVVEEVAAAVVRRLHALHRHVVLHLLVERDPRAERQHRHLQAGAPEPAVFHVLASWPEPYVPTGRTVIPRLAISALASAIECSSKWKIDAASTASAPPRRSPRRGGRACPRRRLAMTGTPTASTIARVSSRSKPSLVPSRSIDVSRISPAPARRPPPPTRPRPCPSACGRRGGETSKPPGHGAWRRSRTRRTACRTRRRSRRSAPGRSTAAVFTLTLSAPARSSRGRPRSCARRRPR